MVEQIVVFWVNPFWENTEFIGTTVYKAIDSGMDQVWDLSQIYSVSSEIEVFF